MSDYSPPYTEEDRKFDEKKKSVCERIRKMPLENLTVGDMMAIIECFNGWNHHSPSAIDVDVLDNILQTHRMDHHCGK